MKYLFVNSVYGVRSTGKLIAAKCRELQEQGHKCVVAYGREAIEDDIEKIKIGTPLDSNVHAIFSRFFDIHGLASRQATKEFIKKIDEYRPDVIWMHNIHGYYINYEILFSWLKAHPEIKKYWTLHDCWSFTGHCAYFTMAKCDKWKVQCEKCPQLNTYPKTVGIDHSKVNFNRKKAAFSGVENMELITPSQWLADLTRESFLSEYCVKVIRNEIDRTIFKPTISNFKERYKIQDKYMILGVAVGWEETKGFPDMLKLRARLDSQYVIFLVGLTQEQIENLPEGMLGIKKTNNQKELVEIYSAADVFVNPTYQDNYPTVNLEAQACGTPVVTYATGGAPETITLKKSKVVRCGDLESIVNYIETKEFK